MKKLIFSILMLLPMSALAFDMEGTGLQGGGDANFGDVTIGGANNTGETHLLFVSTPPASYDGAVEIWGQTHIHSTNSIATDDVFHIHEFDGDTIFQIDGAGEVGIGVVPTNDLHIRRPSADVTIQIESLWNSPNGKAALTMDVTHTDADAYAAYTDSGVNFSMGLDGTDNVLAISTASTLGSTNVFEVDASGNMEFGVDSNKSTMTALGYFSPQLRTIAEMQALTLTGLPYGTILGACSDCTGATICISTGTTATQIGDIGARNASCQ
jgi:hypothetical protein